MASSIANYRSLRRSGIYPGIDLLYYSNPERLEYDFIVRPQANPALIKMHLAGSAPRIDAVVAETGGTLAEVVRAALDEYLDAQVPDAATALASTFGADPEVEVPPRSEWDRG